MAALPTADRNVLLEALTTVLPATAGDAVLHTEPHDRNRLKVPGGILYVDFESAAVGPVEWDLASFGAEVASLVEMRGISPPMPTHSSSTVHTPVAATVTYPEVVRVEARRLRRAHDPNMGGA